MPADAALNVRSGEVSSPLESMRRLAAPVPRPRLHLSWFHGAQAPDAKLPALVVPQGPEVLEQATKPAAAGDREDPAPGS